MHLATDLGRFPNCGTHEVLNNLKIKYLGFSLLVPFSLIWFKIPVLYQLGQMNKKEKKKSDGSYRHKVWIIDILKWKYLLWSYPGICFILLWYYYMQLYDVVCNIPVKVNPTLTGFKKYHVNPIISLPVLSCFGIQNYCRTH